MALLKDRARRSVGGKFHIRGGTAVFGTAQTVNLYESITAVELRTDNKFRAQGALTVVAGTVTLGDVAFAKRAAGTLITTDSIIASDGLLTKEATAGVGRASLDADGAFQVQITAGSAIVLFRAGGTTYYIASTGV